MQKFTVVSKDQSGMWGIEGVFTASSADMAILLASRLVNELGISPRVEYEVFAHNSEELNKFIENNNFIQ